MDTLLLIIKVSVAALIFAIGLGATPGDLTYLWRRPVQLGKAVLAMYVLVPVAAILVAKLLPVTPAVKTAILVLAISAGAPLLPKKLMKLGRDGYVFSLVVTSSLLAIVAVPLWMEIINTVIGRESAVEPQDVARLIARAFAAPLAAGMLMRWPLSRYADDISEWILRVAGIVLLVCGLVLLVFTGPLLIQVGVVPLLVLAGMTVVATAIGHVMGGPDSADRTALAVSCATRHVGIALLAASVVPGPRTAALVLAYTLSSVVVSLLYLRWRKSAV
jgi:BASS family bile acid:Na+ symporter